MKERIIISFCLWAVFFIYSISLAANNNGDGFHVIKESESEILFEWNESELFFERFYVSGTTYDVPRMGDLPLSQIPGHPMVPMASSCRLPDSCELSNTPI